MNVGSKARNTGDREASFTAEVKLAGINPHVDVPDRVVRPSTEEENRPCS